MPKRLSMFIVLTMFLVGISYAYGSIFSLSPYIDTNYTYSANVIATYTVPGISDTMQVIGAQELQVTISDNGIEDSLWVTLEVSNDHVIWMNANALGDSEKVVVGTIKSLYFPRASVYRYYRLRTSVACTLRTDTLLVVWRVGARTSR